MLQVFTITQMKYLVLNLFHDLMHPFSIVLPTLSFVVAFISLGVYIRRKGSCLPQISQPGTNFSSPIKLFSSIKRSREVPFQTGIKLLFSIDFMVRACASQSVDLGFILLAES